MPPFQLDNATANLNLNDPENLPPPPPELLQQQYLYGTVPDSRQQAVISNYAPTRGQGFPTYAPGSGQMDLGQPQQVSRWRVFAQTSVFCVLALIIGLVRLGCGALLLGWTGAWERDQVAHITMYNAFSLCYRTTYMHIPLSHFPLSHSLLAMYIISFPSVP